MMLRDQLIRDEGIRLMPYTDTAGKITIGVGRNLTDKGLSRYEVDVLLDADIRDARLDVSTRLPWSTSLDEARLGVLVALAFNVGIGGLLGFSKMLAAMQANDWETAARELLDSAYHRQVGVRAERLAEQLRLGVEQ